MDVLPAHLNRDSFRDSFKILVALEIIIDLPFGFPINNIISLGVGIIFTTNELVYRIIDFKSNASRFKKIQVLYEQNAP